jgi:hypothetical protein
MHRWDVVQLARLFPAGRSGSLLGLLLSAFALWMTSALADLAVPDIVLSRVW